MLPVMLSGHRHWCPNSPVKIQCSPNMHKCEQACPPDYNAFYVEVLTAAQRCTNVSRPVNLTAVLTFYAEVLTAVQRCTNVSRPVNLTAVLTFHAEVLTAVQRCMNVSRPVHLIAALSNSVQSRHINVSRPAHLTAVLTFYTVQTHKCKQACPPQCSAHFLYRSSDCSPEMHRCEQACLPHCNTFYAEVLTAVQRCTDVSRPVHLTATLSKQKF